MEFFDREHEIQRLRDIRRQAQTTAQFTVITGRRRIGKTSLVMKAYDDEPFLYFFVSRSSETELCNEFAAEISQKLNIPLLGKPEKFADIFQYVMEIAKQRPLTLVIDEFQDFCRVNGAIFSQMQKIWDLNKSQSKLNLIVCGSVYSLITKLFRDHKESLYGRQTGSLKVETFPPSVLKQILAHYNPDYNNHDLLALYVFTGGVPKYVELLMDSGVTTCDKMLPAMVAKDSYFIYEGKNMLIEEFGRDYGRYFDILRLIADCNNTRSRIENVLHCEVSGYLTRLENDFGLIAKTRPIFQQSTNKNVHYSVRDNFLNYWFRFIYKYNSIIEANAFQKLSEILMRDYAMYSGVILERYFREKLIETQSYTHIGNWWNRKGEDEIDIIAADDLSKTAVFYEVKRQRSEISLPILTEKSRHFMEATGKFRDYEVKCEGLYIEDM